MPRNHSSTSILTPILSINMAFSQSLDDYSWLERFRPNFETPQTSHQNDSFVREVQNLKTESETPRISHQDHASVEGGQNILQRVYHGTSLVFRKPMYRIFLFISVLLLLGWLWFLTIPATTTVRTQTSTNQLPGMLSPHQSVDEVLDSRSDPVADESDCKMVSYLFSSLDSISYPCPVNHQAHKVILADLDRPELLPRLSQTYTDVCSEIETTSQASTELVANLAQICTSPTGFTAASLQGNVSTFRHRLWRLSRQIEEAIKLYGTVEDDYFAANKTAVEAFQNGTLSDKEEFQVYQQPFLWQYIPGFNTFDAIFMPFQERFKKMEGTRQGLLAWERETGRLEQILGEIHKLDKRLR